MAVTYRSANQCLNLYLANLFLFFAGAMLLT